MLKTLTGTHAGDERLTFSGPLEDAHDKVRDLWGEGMHQKLDTDPEANSRLAWREGDKIITYTWNGQDVMVLMPEYLLPEQTIVRE